MHIENNILRHYLKDVYFITGTAYAGKSTAAKLLAERYGMILLLLCVATGILSRPLGAATSWVFSRLFSFARWGYQLANTVI